jgi:type VI secretion system protein ImpF
LTIRQLNQGDTVMAAYPNEVLYRHSFWDRLLDPRSLSKERTDANPAAELRRLRDEVHENLSWVLQSRRTPGATQDGLTQLSRSLVTYGLQDLNTLSPANTNDLVLLQQLLKETIETFEPRLRDVKVAYTDAPQSGPGMTIHYRVEALLWVDPVPIPIVFKPVFDVATKTFVLESVKA